MAEELGRIDKPSAENFKGGRKLLFIPLIYGTTDSPADYLERFEKYWGQVENQMSELELKLGQISKVYHEFVPMSGDDGIMVIKELNEKSYQIVGNRLDKGAQMEAIEGSELLTEFTDWGRCLSIGLQNQKVFTTVSRSYAEASKKRNEHIAQRIDETLQADEIGVLLMREGHQVQFPADIQIFYVSPPALDGIKRWLRDREVELTREAEETTGQGDSQ